MTFLNRLGLYMQLTEAGSTNFGERGKRKCHIPHLPLTLGPYPAAVTCGHELADLIPNALLFEVSSDGPRAEFALCGVPDPLRMDARNGRTPWLCRFEGSADLTTHD